MHKLYLPSFDNGSDPDTGVDYRWQVDVQLGIQKCEAVRFRITVVSSINTVSTTRLSSMSLRVGAKYGRFKFAERG